MAVGENTNGGELPYLEIESGRIGKGDPASYDVRITLTEAKFSDKEGQRRTYQGLQKLLEDFKFREV